jgi:hypothetical protein
MAITVKQTNYQVAADHGFEAARWQTAETLADLGAKVGPDDVCRLPVLNAVFEIDFTERTVTFIQSGPEGTIEGAVGKRWEILALHYLCARMPAGGPAGLASFADFPDARGYQSVYEGRVVRRLCATAGRNLESFIAAAERIGGRVAPFGDVGYQFDVFPKAPVIVPWYAGDEDFPPNVSFVYPSNIFQLLPAEDVVVLSECLVSRLQGKGW